MARAGGEHGARSLLARMLFPCVDVSCRMHRTFVQDPQRIFVDASAALAAAAEKQRGKVAAAEAALAQDGGEACAGAERRREELATNLAQEQLLAGKQEAAGAALAALGPGAAADELLAVAGDALAEALDRQLGASVTDPAIFRAHAAKYEAEFLEDMAALGCRPPTVLTRVRCGAGAGSSASIQHLSRAGRAQPAARLTQPQACSGGLKFPFRGPFPPPRQRVHPRDCGLRAADCGQRHGLRGMRLGLL